MRVRLKILEKYKTEGVFNTKTFNSYRAIQEREVMEVKNDPLYPDTRYKVTSSNFIQNYWLDKEDCDIVKDGRLMIVVNRTSLKDVKKK